MNTIKSIRLILIVVLISIFLIAPASPSLSQRSGDVEKRIDALMAQMTLEEKLGQLQQLDGESNGNFRPEHLQLARQGLLVD